MLRCANVAQSLDMVRSSDEAHSLNPSDPRGKMGPPGGINGEVCKAAKYQKSNPLTFVGSFSTLQLSATFRAQYRYPFISYQYVMRDSAQWNILACTFWWGRTLAHRAATTDSLMAQWERDLTQTQHLGLRCSLTIHNRARVGCIKRRVCSRQMNI